MPDDPRRCAAWVAGAGRRAASFTIESSSGRWLVVDGETTDELGLSRVHGPYESRLPTREMPSRGSVRSLRRCRRWPTSCGRHAIARRARTSRASPGAPEDRHDQGPPAGAGQARGARGARLDRRPAAAQRPGASFSLSRTAAWPTRPNRPRRSRGWSAGHRRALLRQRVAIGRGGARSGTRTPRRRRRGRSRRRILEAAAGVEPSGDLPGWRLIELETGGRAGRPIEPHDR